jgi:cbb3-type cytochrome oxidase subunit 3
MGIRGLMSMLGLEWVGVVVLLVAFVTFVAIVVWVLTRPKRSIDRWAQIPLDDSPPPPRSPGSRS